MLEPILEFWHGTLISPERFCGIVLMALACDWDSYTLGLAVIIVSQTAYPSLVGWCIDMWISFTHVIKPTHSHFALHMVQEHVGCTRGGAPSALGVALFELCLV